jgi:ABC-2 type transport system permease protein
MAISEYIKPIKQSLWLGWKLDSNWTDPTLFAIYYMIRPLSGLLIVGFMYIIAKVATGSFNPSFFSYLFIGNTFFIYMIQLSQTMSMLIPEERARYETMKQIYVSPTSIKPYIVGRSLAAILNATISIVLVFVLGDAIFSFLFQQPLPINFMEVNYSALLLSVALGIVALTSVSYVLTAISLVSNRLQWSMSEYVTGIFLLFGGVLFPPTMLPPIARDFSNILPVTWFLTAVRASMMPEFSSILGSSLVNLAIASAASIILALGIFSFCENLAKRKGIIDRKAEA